MATDMMLVRDEGGTILHNSTRTGRSRQNFFAAPSYREGIRATVDNSAEPPPP